MREGTSGNNNFFGRKLRLLLDNSGYEWSDLARHLGVSGKTVYAWMSGTKVPNVYTFREIAGFFKVPYICLLDDSDALPDCWQIADKLGLSEGTVELLMETARTMPGEAMDHLDDALYSMLESMTAAQED